MAYYDFNDDLIYHRCANCSIGRAIPDEDRREGFKTGAERCAECRNLSWNGTCTADAGDAEDEDESEVEGEGSDDDDEDSEDEETDEQAEDTEKEG
jgi:hypothetical protein